MNVITQEILDNLSAEARQSPRGRKNYNFHENLDAPAQRLLNALEPGTEIPVHRHPHTAETYFVVRGKVCVSFFDDNGKPTNSAELCPTQENYGVHIPAGTWHGLEVLESGTVIFEVKDGPYTPISPSDILTRTLSA
ncbi:MAG: WbuC family cupin fold metalloprotein [Opitutales bacterium]|nr:WbuC family cupin fold metalloprotein [Opitutales bacterium]